MAGQVLAGNEPKVLSFVTTDPLATIISTPEHGHMNWCGASLIDAIQKHTERNQGPKTIAGLFRELPPGALLQRLPCLTVTTRWRPHIRVPEPWLIVTMLQERSAVCPKKHDGGHLLQSGHEIDATEDANPSSREVKRKRGNAAMRAVTSKCRWTIGVARGDGSTITPRVECAATSSATFRNE